MRQREIQQIIRGAIKAGAKGVTVRVGSAEVEIKLDEAPTLVPDSNNSFDKIMRTK